MTNDKPRRVPINCPLCDKSEYLVIYRPWRVIDDPTVLYGAASGVPGSQQLVRCCNCGLIYENPRFHAEVILQGYISSNDAGHDTQYERRVNSFTRALNKLEPRLPSRPARILDVGTAGGAFLLAAIRFGYQAYGLEPSAYLVKRCKERGLAVEQGTLDKHHFEPSSFDMLTLWDVLEHLPDPRDALCKAARLLKPGGMLLINYPDIGTWQAKLAGRRFWWILSVHLQHFTNQTIVDICRRTGFEVFHIEPYWQTLEFGYLQGMAVHFKIPFAAIIRDLTPRFIQRIPLPYYASQTTALAKVLS